MQHWLNPKTQNKDINKKYSLHLGFVKSLTVVFIVECSWNVNPPVKNLDPNSMNLDPDPKLTNLKPPSLRIIVVVPYPSPVTPSSPATPHLHLPPLHRPSSPRLHSKKQKRKTDTLT